MTATFAFEAPFSSAFLMTTMLSSIRSVLSYVFTSVPFLQKATPLELVCHCRRDRRITSSLFATHFFVKDDLVSKGDWRNVEGAEIYWENLSGVAHRAAFALHRRV